MASATTAASTTWARPCSTSEEICGASTRHASAAIGESISEGRRVRLKKSRSRPLRSYCCT